MELLIILGIPVAGLLLLGHKTSPETRFWLQIAAIPFILLSIFIVGASLIVAFGIVFLGIYLWKRWYLQKSSKIQLPE